MSSSEKVLWISKLCKKKPANLNTCSGLYKNGTKKNKSAARKQICFSSMSCCLSLYFWIMLTQQLGPNNKITASLKLFS